MTEQSKSYSIRFEKTAQKYLIDIIICGFNIQYFNPPPCELVMGVYVMYNVHNLSKKGTKRKSQVTCT